MSSEQADATVTPQGDHDQGGDPPCWEGQIPDHRDQPDAAPTRPDLATAGQIHDLVTIFYREIVFDELLEPVFSDVAEVDWVEHIPRLIDYWCWILLDTKRYAGAVTRTHRHLHELQAIEAVHCDRWFTLWVACIDERWAGPRAEHAKSHAATLMAGLAKHVFGYRWEPPAPVADAPVSTDA